MRCEAGLLGFPGRAEEARGGAGRPPLSSGLETSSLLGSDSCLSCTWRPGRGICEFPRSCRGEGGPPSWNQPHPWNGDCSNNEVTALKRHSKPQTESRA